MINSRKKFLLAILIVGASAASGFFVWHKLTKPSEENDPVAFYLHVAHPKYNMLPKSVVSTELAGSGESYYLNFLDLLSRGTVIGASHKPSEESWIIELPGPIQQRHGLGKLTVNDAMHQKLLQQSAETLGARFAASSADEYLAVRARYGARADRALFERRFPSSFDGTFQYLAGKPPARMKGPPISLDCCLIVIDLTRSGKALRRSRSRTGTRFREKSGVISALRVLATRGGTAALRLRSSPLRRTSTIFAL